MLAFVCLCCKDVVVRGTTYSRLMTGFWAAKTLFDMAVAWGSLGTACLRQGLNLGVCV